MDWLGYNKTILYRNKWIKNWEFPRVVINRSFHNCIQFRQLKLPSLFAAWLFWTFHTKSDNMKALVILSHSWSPFHPRTCLYGINELLLVSVWPSGVFVWEKTPLRLSMQIREQIWSWPNYHKTKENMNIKLYDLYLFTFYLVYANKST